MYLDLRMFRFAKQDKSTSNNIIFVSFLRVSNHKSTFLHIIIIFVITFYELFINTNISFIYFVYILILKF